MYFPYFVGFFFTFPILSIDCPERGVLDALQTSYHKGVPYQDVVHHLLVLGTGFCISKSYTWLSASFAHQYSDKIEDENRSISERVSLSVSCLTHDTLQHTTLSTHNHYLPLTTLLCHSRFSQTRQTPGSVHVCIYEMVISYHSAFFRSCVPFRSFLVPSLWYVPFIRVYCSLCLTSGLSLFSVPSEYLQIFLGTSDTGILPDTGSRVLRALHQFRAVIRNTQRGTFYLRILPFPRVEFALCHSS